MKRMKRIGSLLLTLVFILCLIPASALPVWAYDVYGTVYASSLPNGAALDVYAATTLVMDTDRTFAYIEGNYDLVVKGGGMLTVDGAISVRTLNVDGPMASVGGTITVSDALYVISDYFYALGGIYAEDLVRINSTHAVIAGKNYGITCLYGNIELNGSGGTMGINVGAQKYALNAQNGSIYLIGDITCNTTATLEACVTAKDNIDTAAGNYLNLTVTGSSGLRAQFGDINLYGDTIDVRAANSYAFLADNGKVRVSANTLAAICDGGHEGDSLAPYGVSAKGDIHLTVSHVAGISGRDYGVYSETGNVTLDGGGAYTIGAIGSSGGYDYDSNIGVYAAVGNINLCGDFTVISDKGHAIHAEQGEIVVEGSLDAQASTKNEVNLRTIYARKGFSFYGTTLNVTGTGGLTVAQNGVSITADSTTIITEDNAAIWCYDVPVYIDSDYLWVQNKNEFEGSSNQTIRSTDLTIYSDDATIVGEDGLRCLGDVVLRGNFAISGYGQAYLAIQADNLDVEGSLTAVGNSQYYPAINVDGEFRFVGDTLSVSGKNTGVSAGSLYAEAQQATVAGETGIWVGGDATLKGDFTVVGTADMAIKAHEDSDVYVEGSLLFSGKNGDENYWYAIDAKNFIFNGTTLAGTGDGGIRGSESISITAQTVDIEADYDRALSSLVVRINSDQVRLVSNGLDVEEDDIGIYRAALYYGSELTMNVTDAYICGCRGIDSWGHDGVATIDGNVTVVGTKSNAITVYGAMTASGSLTLRSEKEYKEAVGYAAIYAHTFTFDGDTFVVESVSQGVRVYGSPLNITAKNVIIRSERRNGIYAVYGLTLRADRGTISGTTAIYAQEQALLYSDNLVIQSTGERSSGIWCENGSVLLSGNIVINTNGWYGINADKDVTFERGYYKITGPKGNAQAVKVGDEGDLYVHSSLQIAKPDGGHVNGNVINGAGDSPAMELLMYAPVGTVDIYVSTPSDGLYPIFDSSVVYGLPPLCSFDSIVWFENGVQMAEGTPFTAGNTYSVEIILSATDGYYFANGVLAKVNGKNSSMTGTVDNNTKLMIRADMGTCANAITQVNLSVATPVEGNKPSTSVTDNEKGYGVDSDDVRWMVSTDGINYTPMAAGAKFEGGKYYRMVTEVQTIGNNYSFKITDKNGSVVPDVQALVNGKAAKVEKTYDQDPEKIITVSVDFGMCNDFMIEQIVLVDVVEPVAGQRPSYKANTFGTGYGINTDKNDYTDVYWLNPAEKWYFIKNGIGWYDVTEGDWVYEHEVFIAGHEYRCIVYVDTEDGYEFAHDKWYEIQITATINGNTAAFKEAGSDYAWHQQISCGFVCEELQYTSGDVNNDGKVNSRDLGLLQQYLNGWDVTINLDAANVNGDGKVNSRDLGLLQQYLNGWNVTLK